MARRRLVEDETDCIGPGGGRGLDVGGGTHAADLYPELRHGSSLHARPAGLDQSRRRAGGILVLHQAGSDQRQPITERRHSRGIARALDAAFRDRGPARGELVAQHTEPPRVDRERLQVAAVEPHEHLLGAAAALRGDLRRHLQIAGVERLEEHEETELSGAVEHLDQPRLLDHLQDEERSRRAALARLQQLVRIDQEILAHHRDALRGEGFRGEAQMLEAAIEARWLGQYRRPLPHRPSHTPRAWQPDRWPGVRAPPATANAA